MKRKFLIVLLSLVCCFCLALGLTACGNSSGGTTDSGQNNEQTGNTDDGSSSDGDNTDSGSGDSGSTDDDGSSSGDSGDSGSSSGDSGTSGGSSSGDTEQGGSTGGGAEEAVSLEYILSSDNSSYIVSGIGGVTSTTVTIPSTYNGLPVTAIADGAFKNNTFIVIIIIADSVTTIGENAFSGCTSLTTATIGSGVTTIGASAFSGCSSLTSVNIPSSVTSIGANAFKDCVKIVIVIILGNPEIAEGAFSGCVLISDVTLSDELLAKVAEILNNVFADSTEITEVKDTNSTAYHTHELTYTAKVEATCTEAGTEEYWYCSTCDKYYSDENGSTEVSKDSLTIATTAHTYTYKYDDNGHWQVCTVCGTKTSSASHTLENNVCTVCGYEATIGIEGLIYTLSYDETYYTVSGIGTCTETEIVIPSTYNDLPVTSIGSKAFYYCPSLTGITIPDSVTSIDSYAFYGCSKLTSVTIGSGVTSISNGAFFDCTSLTSITIPDSVTSIGDYAFEHCTSLTSVTIGNSVTSIEFGAFRRCTSLTSVTIPNSVTSIGGNAFENCKSLTFIEIPNSITSIGESTFSGCSSLVGLTLPFIGGSVKTENDTYQYPFGYIFGSLSCTGCTATTQYYYGSSTISKTHSTYYIPATLTTVTITGGNILSYAFYNCTALTSITILDSVTYIGGYAFYNCTALASINIPDSVTAIGYEAFYNTAYYNDSDNWENNVLYMSNYLIATTTSISGNYTIKDETTVIADGAFYKCTTLESITIPNTVTSIGKRAFMGCSKLTSVTIPYSVTSIGSSTFYGCTALTSVIFENTSGWYVSIKSGATSGTDITSSALSNTSTAATYLTGSSNHSYYQAYYWYRSES